jgi:solute carrier family 26 protein
MYSYQKDYFVEDFISGCSVAMFHLPGMGHALLANLPPVVGIYMAFFPVLAYVIFGSSRHNSMGTFAVIAIMVEKSVNKYSNIHHVPPHGANVTSNESNIELGYGYSPIEVATLVCFLVGAIQVLQIVISLIPFNPLK